MTDAGVPLEEEIMGDWDGWYEDGRIVVEPDEDNCGSHVRISGDICMDCRGLVRLGNMLTAIGMQMMDGAYAEDACEAVGEEWAP